MLFILISLSANLQLFPWYFTILEFSYYYQLLILVKMYVSMFNEYWNCDNLSTSESLLDVH